MSLSTRAYASLPNRNELFFFSNTSTRRHDDIYYLVVRVISSLRVRGSGDYPSLPLVYKIPLAGSSTALRHRQLYTICVDRTFAAHSFGEGRATLDKARTDCATVFAKMTAGPHAISLGGPRVFRGRLILSTVVSDWLFRWLCFAMQLITSGNRWGVHQEEEYILA